jgi:hypothetical protein
MMKGKRNEKGEPSILIKMSDSIKTFLPLIKVGENKGNKPSTHHG